MHVVFFNVLGAGHINPTLPVVRGLVARGDQVTYYTYAARRAEVEAAGAEVRTYGGEDFRLARFHPEGNFVTRQLPATAAMLPELVQEVRTLEPDCIVTDNSAPWGRAVGDVLGIPVVVSISSFVFDQDAVRELRQGTFRIDARNREALHHLRHTWGVDFDESYFPMFFAPHNVAYTGRLLNPVGGALAESVTYVGPMTAPRPRTGDFPLEHYARTERAVVYIAMGSVIGDEIGLAQSFYQPFFDALRDRRDCEVVVSIGRTHDPSLYGVSDSIRIERFVPQVALLPHVDVFVTHCGMNSVNEALYEGVPLLAVPFVGDQPFVARRVAECGVGLVVDRHALDAGALREALDRLLGEPSFRLRAAEMRDDLRSGGGVDAVLEVIDVASRS